MPWRREELGREEPWYWLCMMNGSMVTSSDGTFSVLLALCEGFPSVTSWFPSQKPVTQSLSPVDSSHKGQWRGALMFCSICAWTSGWANNRGVGDLRRHRAHYDVTVMFVFEEAIYRLPVHRKNRYVVKLTCPACIERRTHANLLIQSWCVLTCN